MGGELTYLTGPAGSLRAQRGRPARRWPVEAADTGRPRAACAPTRSAASSCAPSSWSSPATRRCALVEGYEPPEPPSAVELPGRAASGTGATEAPRGLLFHSYEIDAEGIITAARIVPPTSQNQITIEDDLSASYKLPSTCPTSELTWRCEQAVRNHDPCISCAAHFLDVTVERR